MEIRFQGEAGETFQRFIGEMIGYTLEVTTDNGEVFDAELVGCDHDSEWYDALMVRRFDPEVGEGVGEPFSVRVKSVEVF